MSSGSRKYSFAGRRAMHALLAPAVAVALGISATGALAQSSSLYVNQPQQRASQQAQPQTQSQAMGPDQPMGGNRTARGPRRAEHELSPAIRRASFAAVKVPEPRQFAKHDLITIIVRESTETNFEATLETEKDSSLEGEISSFPDLQLRDLLNAQLNPSDQDEGSPSVGVEFNNAFEGDGEYTRSESVTGRITAQVIDVKPNGMLVLEARKHIQTDQETLDLVISGMCRPEDVTVDNTVLSTQLYDLRLDKQHEGELHKSTKKGLLTKLFEALFNF